MGDLVGMQIIDISVTLRDGLAAWPGEDFWRLDPVHRMAEGGPANVSRIQLGLHTGTHVDAPWHFAKSDVTVEALPLDRLVTRARVLDLTGVRAAVSRGDLEGLLTGVPAVLLKTRNSGSLERGEPFRPDFIHLDASAAEYLVEAGIRTVGVDYLSVEGFHASDAPVHHRLLGAGVVVIEGLDLREAAPGDYLLVALPLKIAGGDGAPCRAVLIGQTGSERVGL
ncbi:MAG TPA: cyclase family protein [Methylomirabilota bacterium]